MKLIYLNAELDASFEYELLNITPNGFKVTIVYVKGNWIAEQLKDATEVFESCTEVHNLFDVGAIAFESDIRATGFVRKQIDIESVTIELQ